MRCRLRKKFTDDRHNSSHSAFGSGELKKVHFLYTFPWDLCLIKALIYPDMYPIACMYHNVYVVLDVPALVMSVCQSVSRKVWTDSLSPICEAAHELKMHLPCRA